MSSGAYEEYCIKIPFKNWGEPIILKIFSDLHADASNCAHEELEQCLEDCRKEVKKYNIWFLGNGDYNDAFSFSEREHMNVFSGKMHGTTKDWFSKLAETNSLQLFERMKDFKERIIGLGEGNHFAVFPKWNITTTQYLASLLGTKYLGCPSVTSMFFQKESKDNTSLMRTVFMHHGLSGGGRTAGITLNQIAHMTNIMAADICVMGHDHQLAFKKESRLVGPTKFGSKCKHRDILFVRTGGYQKSYEPGTESFASSRLMKPSTFGSPYVIMTPLRSQKNGEDIIDIKLDFTTRLL